ncbi:MAG: DEAD/DEAH box helicase [Alicyclobacillus sp.]|nr:DEAD/DEAH box helicase [Alicyclobacillus sp.]
MQAANVPSQLSLEPGAPFRPQIIWQDGPCLEQFTAYLDSIAIADQNRQDWTLLQLSYTAAQARLIEDFDQLYALEHVRGFTPLPHQVETAQKVLQTLHGRAILADEVGLGKTIEAGLVMKEYMLRGLARKVLILVPASLVLQWTRELNEKFRIPAVAQKKAWMWEQYDVLVASIDMAKREPHRSFVLQTDWDILVIDEAHKLKNARTKNWEVVNQIRNKYMLLLTATPMQNNLKELHTLVTLLKPGHLGNAQDFVAQHLASAREAKNPSRLRSEIATVMIRNRREDGNVQLPPRRVQVVALDLSPEERALYDAVHAFMRADYAERRERRLSMLPLLTLQREICSSPYAAVVTLQKMKARTRNREKTAWIDELLSLAARVPRCTKVDQVLRMVQECPDKWIVFTEYRATQEFLMYMLQRADIPAVPFRGGFKRGKKDWMTELFERRAKVLVATESGGEGINLQFCSRMVNYDLPWNPMRLEQRIGRIHRLGQDRTVSIFNLATKGTIEEHIVELLQEKIRMFETVIGELDFIVGNPSFATEVELGLLDIAMTAESPADLERKVGQLGTALKDKFARGR